MGKNGDDPEGQILLQRFKVKGINTRGIFVDKKIPTISKTRVIAQHQQIVRIDREKSGVAGSKEVFHKIRKFIKKNIASFDAVIISDYGKGLVTPELVDFVRERALANNKIIIVDPKVEHFS